MPAVPELGLAPCLLQMPRSATRLSQDLCATWILLSYPTKLKQQNSQNREHPRPPDRAAEWTALHLGCRLWPR